MPNQIKNNSKLLYLQARQLFEQAHAKFENGTIKSEPKLVEAVFQSFQSFFTSMGKPNMVPRYAPEQGPPWSEDYNLMMTEIRQDLELLFQEVDILGRSLYSDFNHNMIQHEIVSKQFENVLDKMRDLETYAGLNGEGVNIGRDDFLSKDKIDYDRIAGTPLEIVDGGVTLPQVSRTNVATDAKITIVAGNRKGNGFILGTESNGFPGNNTEIHSVTDDVLTNRNYIPTFLGEENNHGDMTTVLDGSPNTWFEYEKVNVREHDKIRVAKNEGWDYQVHENQTVAWAEDPEDGILKLHMQLILDKEEVINQINCNMYTPPNYGAKTAIVKNILVSDGKEAPRSVLPKQKTDDQYQFHFPPVKAKVISILFEQPSKYLTDIGHIFYEKKMQTEDSSEYAMDMATKKYKYAPRMEGPLVSLEDLGISVKVNESNIEATYPLLSSGSPVASNIGETINRLMSSVDMDAVDMGVEKFEGFRWCIGVRDIEVFSCEYATEGELVTQPFFFDKPLDKISINVNENVPSSFSNNDAMKYEWLKYFVSIDDGATWYPITPLAQEMVSEEQPPKIYTIRMIETSEQQLENKKAYIESEYPVYSIRMKIIARRPDDYTLEDFTIKDSTQDPSSFVKSSPIVNSYMFHAVTRNDVLDSEESDRMGFNIEDIGSGDEGVDPTIPAPPNNGGQWGDDDGDGIPNWADPDHPEYIPDPPAGWQPPGNPGTYPEYPIEDEGDNEELGGPFDDDDGDGIPNHQDPDWKPPLTVEITNKKTEWCMDEDLLVKGQVYSTHDLQKVELLVNGTKQEEQILSEQYATFSFVIPAHTFTPRSITVLVRGYDEYGTAIDTDVVNIIDCTDIPPEDRPDERSNDELNIVFDRKPDKICTCDPLSFYGSAQGPHPIQALVYQVNGVSIDPLSLGTPPEDDPCGTGMMVAQVTRKQATEEELLEIKDFGEWLDAFEEENDCGCKHKKKKSAAPRYAQQATPFQMMTTGSEQSFQVEIPYWKLREVGAVVGESLTVDVIAIDSMNEQVIETFSVMVEDCDNPPFDEEGNPRVRDCYLLESIDVHYYDHDSNSVVSKTIPANALPYEGITNHAGSGITVGWKKQPKAPIIMQTSGYDDSGYAFQLHAVGLHYMNEYDQPETKWTAMIGETSSSVVNAQKMIGDSARSADWVNDIQNGDYSTSPSLGGINDYAVLIMDNDWIEKACEVTLPDFEPTQHEAPEEPEENCQEINDCLRMTHIAFQVYDEDAQQLKMYKVDMQAGSKDVYTLATRNGSIALTIGWVSYFKAPAIQIQSGAGTNNVLLTAVGIMYENKCGEAQTSWSTQLRYRTNGVQYPEFAIGRAKTLDEVHWVSGGTVDMTKATFIGKQGDMVVYTIDSEIVNQLCEPEKTIDDEVGIDPVNPPDVPTVEFIDETDTICIEDGDVTVNAKATDQEALKEVTYHMSVNGILIYGPYTDTVNEAEHSIDFLIQTGTLQIGDTVELYVKATNLFGVEQERTTQVLIERCTIPSVPCGTVSEGGSGPAIYYYQLGTQAGEVTITYDFFGAVDKMDVYYKDQLLASTGNTTYTGSLTFDYNPEPDEYRIQVVMNDGQSGSQWEYTVGCPVPPDEEGETDEGTITNPYKILARLKWGGSPNDMDFHSYVGRDVTKHLGYNSGGGNEADIKATYSDANGTMYLNYDWTSHDSDDDFNTEYEVITIDGFANQIITFLVHRFTSGDTIDASHPPTVEIVDALTSNVVQTITMPASDWSTDYVRAIEIQLDADGKYASTLRGKASIANLDPNL